MTAPRTQSTPSRRSALWLRLVVAPLILAVMLAVLWVHDRTGDPLSSDILLLFLGGAGGLEMALMLRRAGRPVDIGIVAVGCALLAGAGLLIAEHSGAASRQRMEYRVLLLTACVVALLMRSLLDTRPGVLDRIGSSLIALLYVGLLFSWMREVGATRIPAAHHARLLAWVMVVAKASDIGGWVIGKPFGRHKMVPSVSPGKSWEGLAGGLAASVLAAVFLPALLGLTDVEAWSMLRRVAFGLVVGGAAVLAGVTQSGWKRRLGAKDSSTILPELGGALDMIDSMLLAAPVAWAWFELGL